MKYLFFMAFLFSVSASAQTKGKLPCPTFCRIKVYPTSTITNVVVDMGQEIYTTLILYDSAGRKVKTKAANARVFTMNIASYKAGLYYLRVITKYQDEKFKIYKN